MIPLKDGVEVSREIRLERKTAESILQGRPLHASDLSEDERGRLKRGQRIGLLHGSGKLLAIAESQADGGSWISENPQVLRILRVFHG